MEPHETREIQPNAFGASAWRARATEGPEEPAAARHWRSWEPAQPYMWLLGAVMLGALAGALLGLAR